MRTSARGTGPGRPGVAPAHVAEDLGDLLLVQRLLLQQFDDEPVKHFAVVEQDLVGLLVGLLDQSALSEAARVIIRRELEKRRA